LFVCATTVVLAVRRILSDDELEVGNGEDSEVKVQWPFKKRFWGTSLVTTTGKTVRKRRRRNTTTTVNADGEGDTDPATVVDTYEDEDAEYEEEDADDQPAVALAPRSRPAKERQPSVPLSSDLPECMDMASFTNQYTDEDTGETVFHGQCEPSASPGAYYSKTLGVQWSCWSEDTPQELRNDGGARDYGFDGACNINDWYKAITPKDVEVCDHVPVDCSPGAARFVGACFSKMSEMWLCLQRPDTVENQNEQQEVVEQFAAGDCKSMAIRNDLTGRFYDGACYFEDKEQDVFMCDTVVATYGQGDAGTCGGGDYDSACFSLVPGVVWQCFPEHLENEGCASTPSSEGNYFGACYFPTHDKYDDAMDASHLQSSSPVALLEQTDAAHWLWSRRRRTEKSTTTSIPTEDVDAGEESDDSDDEFVVPGEVESKRQAHQPFNPILPECTDQASFRHTYTVEETAEVIYSGQCDISTSPGAYFSDSSDDVWSCWSEQTPTSLQDDLHAIEAGFVGACNFGDWHLALEAADAPTCDHVPIDCSPGSKTFWGACHTPLSEKWLCIQQPSEVEDALEQQKVVQTFAGGACRSYAVRDDPEGHMYAGVCAFGDKEQEVYQCDTVDATYEDGNAGTCGGGDYDSACFSLVFGVVWQCFPETLENHGCASTPSSDGMYAGACLFPRADGYDAAKKGHALQVQASASAESHKVPSRQ